MLHLFLVVEDGALLPSPTIDKLMPALPRSREGSPKKTIASRHGSPQKGSPKKLTKMAYKGRSQSVGANHVADVTTNGTTTNGSPKRQLRSAVTIEDVKDGMVKPANKDTKVTITAPGERRPRPSKSIVCGWPERQSVSDDNSERWLCIERRFRWVLMKWISSVSLME